MPSYQWVKHKDKRILFMDIATDKTEVLRDIIGQLEPVIEKEPPKSIRCVCSTKGGRFNAEITQMLKAFTKHNEPYMKMTAVIGVDGLQSLIFKGVLLFTGRKNLILKNSKEEALNWLAEQP